MRYSIKYLFACSCTLIGIVILSSITFHSGRHAKYYSFIADKKLISALQENYAQTSPKNNLRQCEYQQIVDNAQEIFDVNEVETNFDNVQQGGEYTPTDCIPKYSTAVIVCYRNRPQQLEFFLNYMHTFLQHQNIHYRIFIADQNNSEPFNRALMLNYGAAVAANMSYTCLILHDVDLIPQNLANMYACTKYPRHMSASVDTMRYNLPYHQIVGGVLAINSSQFRDVNGMSNLYFGWGGEDDDLYRRLMAKKLHPVRFSPWISRYTMLHHKHAKPSPIRHEMLANSLKRQFSDGLNSLSRRYEIKLRDLYTHVIVD